MLYNFIGKWPLKSTHDYNRHIYEYFSHHIKLNPYDESNGLRVRYTMTVSMLILPFVSLWTYNFTVNSSSKTWRHDRKKESENLRRSDEIMWNVVETYKIETWNALWEILWEFFWGSLRVSFGMDGNVSIKLNFPVIKSQYLKWGYFSVFYRFLAFSWILQQSTCIPKVPSNYSKIYWKPCKIDWRVQLQV